MHQCDCAACLPEPIRKARGVFARPAPKIRSAIAPHNPALQVDQHQGRFGGLDFWKCRKHAGSYCGVALDVGTGWIFAGAGLITGPFCGITTPLLPYIPPGAMIAVPFGVTNVVGGTEDGSTLRTGVAVCS